MITPSPLRVGAVAVALTSLAAGCASSGSLGVPPETILSAAAAVISAIPRSTTTSTSTGSGPSSDRRGSSGRGARIPASPAPSAGAARLLRTADAYVGTRYTWGGNTPGEGFDCSGFTKYVFAKQGIALPRTSREQSGVGDRIAADFHALIPGDLMFFAEPGEAISHVAIYAGNGRILHSSSSLGGVGYTDLNTGGEWFVAYFVAARRVE